MTKICICGGGNLGHVCAGFLSAQSDVEVNLLTTHPDSWSSTIEVDDPDAWAEEQIDLLLQRKPELVRAILKERLLRGETIENEPEPKRSFAWNRSLAEIAHVLEKENCLPKGSVVFRKKGAILNLRKKLAFLYGNK